ncbi:OB-fold domain-containing protein [soil metagenome]
MSEPGERLAPPVTEVSQPFWDATEEQRFLFPWCRSCEQPFWHPRPFCPRDLSTDIEWRQASGTCVVHAASGMPKPAHPGMEGREPYVVAIVELDEGVRLMSNVVGGDPWSVAVGDRIHLAWEPLADGRHLYVFERD